jgi:hypothetical protein
VGPEAIDSGLTMESIKQRDDVTGSHDKRPTDCFKVAAQLNQRLANERPLARRGVGLRPEIWFDHVEAQHWASRGNGVPQRRVIHNP